MEDRIASVLMLIPFTGKNCFRKCKVNFTFGIVNYKTIYMNLLLPHIFKKIGAAITPIGFLLWLSMQYGLVRQFLIWSLGKPTNSETAALYQAINSAVAIISFMCFLAGLYFVAFSKEKIEDEMIQRARLDSFQFAALIQIIFVIIGFMIMIVYKEPSEGGLMLFFIVALASFWTSFIARFTYTLHVRLK